MPSGGPGECNVAAATDDDCSARSYLGAFQVTETSTWSSKARQPHYDRAHAGFGRRQRGFRTKGLVENTVNQVDPKTGTLELQTRFRIRSMCCSRPVRQGAFPKPTFAKTSSWFRSARSSGCEHADHPDRGLR